MDYRLYLLDGDRHIVAVDAFAETSDAEARENAHAIYGACDDVFRGFELWRGASVIETDRNERGRRYLTFEELTQKRQQMICDREQTLFEAHACVRQSLKLLAAISSKFGDGKVSQASI